MDKELTLFEVETIYKSGRRRTEVLEAKTEKEMWEYYDKHHNNDLVESTKIVDAWCA